MSGKAGMTIDEAKKRFPPIFTIYDHPRDFPNSFVVRVWYGEIPGDALLYADLKSAREAAWGMGAQVKLPRSAFDDDKIVESWI